MTPAAGSGLDRFDVAVFAASTDDSETNRRFANSLRLDYPILSDADKSTAQAYGVVDAERQVPYRWTFYIGPDGKILHIDKSVRPATHGIDVATKLRELGIAERDRN